MVMFQGLRPALKKSNKPKKTQADLNVIKTADELLSTENNLVFIETVKLLIKLSNRFNSFYLPIIKKFAEFVQNIPFNQEINFLERGLERGARTLSLCLKCFFPEETDFV